MEHDVGCKELGVVLGCRQGAWLTSRLIFYTSSLSPSYLLIQAENHMSKPFIVF